MKTRNQKIATLLLNIFISIFVSVIFFIKFVEIADKYLPTNYVLASFIIPLCLGVYLCSRMIKNN